MAKEAIYILIRKDPDGSSKVIGVYSSWSLANKMQQADYTSQRWVLGFEHANELNYKIERKLVEA